MIVQEGLNAARDALSAAGIEGAERDARWLVAGALNMPPDRVALHLKDPLTDAHQTWLTAAVAARRSRKPISQIVGGRWFFGRWFKVTGDVLDPRPETETLVTLALKAPFARVLDLGTGSGCILLSLLAERQGARGSGVDVSDAALDVARENAQALDVDERADLLRSDWYSAVQGTFDLIVSNPPYISANDYAGLAPDVARWEPRLALTPGDSGLEAYREIFGRVRSFLKPGGRILVEIGPTQGPEVSAFARIVGLENIEIYPDMDGRDRVVQARYPV